MQQQETAFITTGLRQKGTKNSEGFFYRSSRDISYNESTADALYFSFCSVVLSTHLTVAVAVDNGHKETLKEREDT